MEVAMGRAAHQTRESRHHQARRWRVCLSAAMALAWAIMPAWPVLPVRAESPSQTNDPEVIVTPIAFQSFEHGAMLWRKDTGQISVVYTTLRTKTGAPCQELYRDTYSGQPYTLPAAPNGRFSPVQGFGWLYAQDPQLA